MEKHDKKVKSYLDRAYKIIISSENRDHTKIALSNVIEIAKMMQKEELYAKNK